MDGFTMKVGNEMLQRGETLSEVRRSKMKEEMSNSQNIGGKSFADTLSESINKVNTLQKESDTLMQKLATGESKNIPEVMVAAEKADIALKLMVQVRNKVIDAYSEIMKMQV